MKPVLLMAVDDSAILAGQKPLNLGFDKAGSGSKRTTIAVLSKSLSGPQIYYS